MKAKRAQALDEAVVGYMRVSTTRQGEKGISLDLQERAIRSFAQTRGLPVIGVFSDVASGRGRSSIRLRDGLRQALEACRTYDAILVVWDWSRPSREQSTAEELLRLLPLPERVHSIRDDESYEDARKHARIAHAQEERDAISKRTKIAMNELKRAGKTFGNPDMRTVQVSGRDAWSQKSEDIARSIAAVLRTLPDWKALKRRERIREPLKRAKEMLAEDDEAMRKHPTYGLF
jgi:DNA invertase Pin-like site-specific DNA recombinase